MSYHAEELSPHFGPFSLDISSNELLVNAALYLSLRCPSPPPDLVVYAVNVYIRQQVTITSPRPGGKTTTILGPKLWMIQEGEKSGYGKPGFAELARARGSMLYEASSTTEGSSSETSTSEGWEFTRFSRLPEDNDLRPTTAPGTKSPLRFLPSLYVEVIFSGGIHPGIVKIASVLNKELDIAS
jgi:hypothetical protein